MLDDVLLKELAPDARVLRVSLVRGAKDPRVTEVGSEAEGDTPAGGFDAALVHLERPSAQGLRLLRARLRPGGAVLVAIPRPSGWQRLTQALGAGESDEARLEALCRAPLLAGLEEAHCVVDGEDQAVLARVPRALEPLDELFTQPR